MPQLDKVTIIHHYITLTIIFFCVFFFVLWEVLPLIYTALRIQNNIKEDILVENINLNVINELHPIVNVKVTVPSTEVSFSYNSIYTYSVWMVIYYLEENEKY